MDVSSQHVTNVPHTGVWDTDGGEAVYGTEQKIVGTSGALRSVLQSICL